jgi:hypothetical protein
MWPFLWNILEPIISLKIFDEGLSNKKHVHIFLAQCCIYKPKFTSDIKFMYYFSWKCNIAFL